MMPTQKSLSSLTGSTQQFYSTAVWSHVDTTLLEARPSMPGVPLEGPGSPAAPTALRAAPSVLRGTEPAGAMVNAFGKMASANYRRSLLCPVAAITPTAVPSVDLMEVGVMVTATGRTISAS